jgi:hypothetical protein
VGNDASWNPRRSSGPVGFEPCGSSSHVCVAVGIWAGRSGAWAGWVAVTFFGVCLFVAIIQAVTAGRTFLKLDRRGFAMGQWVGGAMKCRGPILSPSGSRT